MGTGTFPGLRCDRGVILTPHPLLVPRSKNAVELYLNSPQGPSWPMKGWNLIVTVTSSVWILYHTDCGNFYPADGQDWLQFALKFPTSNIILNRLIDFISQHFKLFPFFKYVCITYTFSTEIIIICCCVVVSATQRNICTFVGVSATTQHLYLCSCVSDNTTFVPL
jgi:hypothetical protein